MGLSYRDGIAVLELIAYPPLLLGAIYLSWKFNWKSAAACWRFVITLGLLRIIAASCTLALMSSYTTGLYRTAIVCDLIGISPLTLIGLGLLSQINISTRLIPDRNLRIIGFISLIGLIVGVIGISKPEDTGAVKAAIVIFLAVFAGLMTYTLYVTTRWRQLRSRTQRNAVLAIWVASPFMLVRLLYAAIGDLGSDKSTFGVLNGNPTVYLCMSVLEEIIVMVIYLGFGFTFDKDGFGGSTAGSSGNDYQGVLMDEQSYQGRNGEDNQGLNISLGRKRAD